MIHTGKDQLHSKFCFRGLYRVQGSISPTSSRLEGIWMQGREGMLTDIMVNDALVNHPAWGGVSFSSLRAAEVSARIGEFASRADILYKKSNFTADADTSAMPVNIIDVIKSRGLWCRRRPFLVALFGKDCYEHAEELVRDLTVTIANEYFLHEGGHYLGYDVDCKTADGYFKPAGSPAWMLIYLEELRADLHAFGLAASLLNVDAAAAIFVYNVLLRLGVHVEGVQSRREAPYGAIPYLLFCVLRDVGVCELVDGATAFHWPRTEVIQDWMGGCAEHATRHITVPEASAQSPLDAALISASYARARMQHDQRLSEFDAFIRTALTRLSGDSRY